MLFRLILYVLEQSLMMRFSKIFLSALITLILCMGSTQINAAIWDPVVNYFMSTEKWLSQHTVLIQSNNSSPALEDKIKQARVVILLEGHSDSPQLIEKNIQLIHRFWKKGDLLLAEGGVLTDSRGRSRPFPTLKTSIVNHSRNWDLPSSPSFQALFQELRVLVTAAESLPAYLYLPEVSPEVDEEFQQIYAVLSTGPARNVKLSALNSQESTKIVEELASNAVGRLKEVEHQMNELVKQEFLDRQIQLVAQIEAALKETQGVVWVIAGEAHGRYLTSWEKPGVQYLYDALEKDVPYATVTYRLSPQRSQEELQGLMNDPSLIPQRETQAAQEKENVRQNWMKELREFSQRFGSLSRVEAFLWIGNMQDQIEEILQGQQQTLHYSKVKSKFLQFALETMLHLP